MSERPKKSKDTAGGESTGEQEEEPLDMPPTPERVPPNCVTPPPGPSKEDSRAYQRKSKKRRSKSLDGGEESQSSSQDGGRSSPEDGGCPICLGRIDNKAKTDTCFHEFCFTCLIEWAKVRPVCPLCKGRFSYVMHKIKSDTEYERYDLPPAVEPATAADNDQLGNLPDYLMFNRRFRYHTTLTHHQLSRRRELLSNQLQNMVLPALPDWGSSRNHFSHFRRRRGAGTSEFRREIYTRDLWVEPLADITGRYRNCSPDWYRANEAQIHRLVPFLNRELLGLLEGGPHQSQQAWLTNQITEWVTRFEIQSPEMRDNLLPYLGIRTEHFQHEFFNFARSTYDLVGYDNNARYTARLLPAAEVVSSGSDSDTPAARSHPRRQEAETAALLSSLFSPRSRDRSRDRVRGRLYLPGSRYGGAEAEAPSRSRSADRRVREDRREGWRRWRREQQEQMADTGVSGSRHRSRSRSPRRRRPASPPSSVLDRSCDAFGVGFRDRRRITSESLVDPLRPFPHEGRSSASTTDAASAVSTNQPAANESSGSRISTNENQDNGNRQLSNLAQTMNLQINRLQSIIQRHRDIRDNSGTFKRHLRETDRVRQRETDRVRQRETDRTGQRETDRTGQRETDRTGQRGPDRESDKGKRKSRKPSKYMRNHQDLARNFPQLLSDDDPNLTIDLSSPNNPDASRRASDASRRPSDASRRPSDASRPTSAATRRPADANRSADSSKRSKDRSADTSAVSTSSSGRPPTSPADGEASAAASVKRVKSSGNSNVFSVVPNHATGVATVAADSSDVEETEVESSQSMEVKQINRSIEDVQIFSENDSVLVVVEDRIEEVAGPSVKPEVVEGPSSLVRPEDEPPGGLGDHALDLSVPKEEAQPSASREPGVLAGTESIYPELVRPKAGSSRPLSSSASSSSKSSCIYRSSDEEDSSNNYIRGPSGHFLSDSTGLVPMSGTARMSSTGGGEISSTSRGEISSTGGAGGAAVAGNLSDSSVSEPGSDLEVVDVIKAKAVKKKNPEIVCLSDSETEADPPQGGSFILNPDEPIEISSGTDEDEDTTDPWNIPPPPPCLRSLNQDFYNWENTMWGDFDQTADRYAPSRWSCDGAAAPRKDKGTGKKSKPAPPPSQEESSDDDLIVVRTDYNTVDPITKKEIVEPVKNKLCGHIYEKSTIYAMIDMARENSKPVKCPYMGCNRRDFKKTDLVKDREVLGHLEKVRAEREEEAEAKSKAETERKRLKAARKLEAGGEDSDQSADSIIEDVIEMIRGERSKKKAQEQVEDAALEPGSSTSTSLTDGSSSSSQTPSSAIVQEAATLTPNSSDQTDADATKDGVQPGGEGEPSKTTGREKRKTTSNSGGEDGGELRKVPPSKKRHRILKAESDSEEDTNTLYAALCGGTEASTQRKIGVPESDSDSDVPLSKARKARRRKIPPRLNDSWSGSDLDSDEDTTQKKKKVSAAVEKSPSKRKQRGKKITIKKVTETWVFEKKEGGKGKKKVNTSASGKVTAASGKVTAARGKITAARENITATRETESGGEEDRGKGKKGTGTSTEAARPRRRAQAMCYVESSSGDDDFVM